MAQVSIRLDDVAKCFVVIGVDKGSVDIRKSLTKMFDRLHSAVLGVDLYT